MALSAQPAPISMTFGQSSISIAGVPPGHDVLVFSIAREQRSYWVDVVQRQNFLSGPLTSGARSWELGQPVPGQSVWCAIDLSNADYAVGSPGGFNPGRIEPAPLFVKRAGAGALEALQHDRADAVIILAHPGSGAWIARSVDGGVTDAEPRNGHAALRFDAMRPASKAGPPPPRDLSPNDIIILIDPLYLEVWSGRVGREIQP